MQGGGVRPVSEWAMQVSRVTIYATHKPMAVRTHLAPLIAGKGSWLLHGLGAERGNAE